MNRFELNCLWCYGCIDSYNFTVRPQDEVLEWQNNSKDFVIEPDCTCNTFDEIAKYYLQYFDHVEYCKSYDRSEDNNSGDNMYYIRYNNLPKYIVGVHTPGREMYKISVDGFTFFGHFSSDQEYHIPCDQTYVNRFGICVQQDNDDAGNTNKIIVRFSIENKPIHNQVFFDRNSHMYILSDGVYLNSLLDPEDSPINENKHREMMSRVSKDHIHPRQLSLLYKYWNMNF
jgi:hypothetical protein